MRPDTPYIDSGGRAWRIKEGPGHPRLVRAPEHDRDFRDRQDVALGDPPRPLYALTTLHVPDGRGATTVVGRGEEIDTTAVDVERLLRLTMASFEKPKQVRAA